MTSPQLQSLSIESFRGCVEPFKLDFQKGKTITLKGTLDELEETASRQ